MGKASRYVPAVGTFGHKWYPEDIVGYPQMTTGDYYFVDAARTTSGGGKSWEKAFSDLDEALATVGDGDVIYMAPGTYTGNYSTPDETEAQNVSVIGVAPGMPGIRGGVNLIPTTSSSPIITNNASGWRYSNLCLRPGSTSSGFELVADQDTTTYIAGTAGSISQGVTIDNCMFWGGGGASGKYGIVAAGTAGSNGIHYANIINNHFMYINATSGVAIYGAAGGNPNIGWRVIGNQFGSNKSHINCSAGMGWVGSRFERNSFPTVGVYASTNEGLFNVRASATPAFTGGNAIVDNFFGCLITEYADGSTTNWVRTNGYDYGMSNGCRDGVAAGEIGH